MVCPMCITAAIVANAPGIAAAVGGLAAAKVAIDKRDQRRVDKTIRSHPQSAAGDRPVSRLVVERKEISPITVSYDDI